MDKVAEDLKFALVLKFLAKHHSIDELRLNIIKTWDFKEVPMLSFMNLFHALQHLVNERDYLHAWAREIRVIVGCQFRLYNWFMNFDVNKEPSMVVQYIYLPGLSLMLYWLDCLKILALSFGKFLGTDNTNVPM